MPIFPFNFSMSSGLKTFDISPKSDTEYISLRSDVVIPALSCPLCCRAKRPKYIDSAT